MNLLLQLQQCNTDNVVACSNYWVYNMLPKNVTIQESMIEGEVDFVDAFSRVTQVYLLSLG